MYLVTFVAFCYLRTEYQNVMELETLDWLEKTDVLVEKMTDIGYHRRAGRRTLRPDEPPAYG